MPYFIEHKCNSHSRWGGAFLYILTSEASFQVLTDQAKPQSVPRALGHSYPSGGGSYVHYGDGASVQSSKTHIPLGLN